VRSLTRSTNELFILDQSQTLTHHWQDKGSSIWRRNISYKQAKPHVINFDSFTTHIHFATDNIAQKTNLTVSITSSELQYLLINNVAYTVDSKVAAMVSPGMMGNITIISSATDLASPVLHITSW
jgi:hypothetical protein